MNTGMNKTIATHGESNRTIKVITPSGRIIHYVDGKKYEKLEPKSKK